MVHKVTVGLQQKIGQPNFGSVGASCSLEVLLSDAEANRSELMSFRIKEAFARCRQSIEEELSALETGHEGRAIASPSPSVTTSRPPNRKPRPATEAQIRAIRAIASKAGVVLATELEGQFGVRSPNQLTVSQASQLIDSLKTQPA